MLHSAIKFSPDPPSFKDIIGDAVQYLNADDYPIQVCCDSIKDISAEEIRKVRLL